MTKANKWSSVFEIFEDNMYNYIPSICFYSTLCGSISKTKCLKCNITWHSEYKLIYKQQPVLAISIGVDSNEKWMLTLTNLILVGPWGDVKPFIDHINLPGNGGLDLVRLFVIVSTSSCTWQWVAQFHHMATPTLYYTTLPMSAIGFYVLMTLTCFSILN